MIPVCSSPVIVSLFGPPTLLYSGEEMAMKRLTNGLTDGEFASLSSLLYINQKSIGFVCVYVRVCAYVNVHIDCFCLTEAENSLFSLTGCRFSCGSEPFWLVELSEELRVDSTVMTHHLDGAAALILDADVRNVTVWFLHVNNRF